MTLEKATKRINEDTKCYTHTQYKANDNINTNNTEKFSFICSSEKQFCALYYLNTHHYSVLCVKCHILVY